jgi:hypothetical protein
MVRTQSVSAFQLLGLAYAPEVGHEQGLVLIDACQHDAYRMAGAAHHALHRLILEGLHQPRRGLVRHLAVSQRTYWPKKHRKSLSFVR